MNKLLCFFLILLFSNTIIFSQDSISIVKIEPGFRDELSFIKTDGPSGFSSLPLNFHITAGVRLFEHYKIDFRAGILYIASEFYGIDRGLFLQADILNTGFFAEGGIDFMNNSAGKGGEMSYQVLHPEATFYCIGGGYNASKHFILDLMYYIPKDKVYSISISKLGYSNLESTYSGGFVLGFQYSFSIGL